ncbi:hypothetical protein FRC11_009738 [Ceratobasidium sp. 423]|nr:hypothetical protein FRC11_009738 [Ceratobasidium sp. 423]
MHLCSPWAKTKTAQPLSNDPAHPNLIIALPPGLTIHLSSALGRPLEQNLNLKLKEKEDALARHLSATLGQHAGDLIAFFESGGQKAASDAAKSVGSEVDLDVEVIPVVALM